MGFILYIFIQFFAEIVFTVFFQLPFDWFFMKSRQDNWGRAADINKVTFLICTILGLCTGTISLLFYNQSIIINEAMRFLNLFITPYLAGKIMYYIHDYRTYEPDRVYLFANFWNTFIFAFGMTLIRYIFL